MNSFSVNTWQEESRFSQEMVKASGKTAFSFKRFVNWKGQLVWAEKLLETNNVSAFF